MPVLERDSISFLCPACDVTRANLREAEDDERERRVRVACSTYVCSKAHVVATRGRRPPGQHLSDGVQIAQQNVGASSLYLRRRLPRTTHFTAANRFIRIVSKGSATMASFEPCRVSLFLAGDPERIRKIEICPQGRVLTLRAFVVIFFFFYADQDGGRGQ